MAVAWYTGVAVAGFGCPAISPLRLAPDAYFGDPRDGLQGDPRLGQRWRRPARHRFTGRDRLRQPDGHRRGQWIRFPPDKSPPWPVARPRGMLTTRNTSRKAACVPGGSGRLRHLPANHQAVRTGGDVHGLAFLDRALQDHAGERVLQAALDHPLQRTGAIERVVAFVPPAIPAPPSSRSSRDLAIASSFCSRSSWMSTIVAMSARCRRRNRMISSSRLRNSGRKCSPHRPASPALHRAASARLPAVPPGCRSRCC